MANERAAQWANLEQFENGIMGVKFIWVGYYHS
jgi:hypothetical protein